MWWMKLAVDIKQGSSITERPRCYVRKTEQTLTEDEH